MSTIDCEHNSYDTWQVKSVHSKSTEENITSITSIGRVLNELYIKQKTAK